MRHSILLAAALLLATPAPTALAGVARNIHVIDGDTVQADVLVWPQVVITSRIRLHRIDAPEMHGASACEEAAGLASKKYLEELLQGAEGKMIVEAVTVDSFGRVVAELTLGGINLNDRLVASGNAALWTGRRVEWPCNR